MPKVSILLPVHNSVGKTNFLQQMLDSIVHQTYENFELLILDNQSTDNTANVCETIAQQDSRIKVHIDTQQRSTEGAIDKLISLARGEFIMVVSAYDLLNYHYIQVLFDELKTNKDIDMVYTNGTYINANNQVGQELIINKDGVYNSRHYYENFCKAIHNRKTLPFIFGLFRKEVYHTLWPCESILVNVDNLWMAKFFLNKRRASFVDYETFYYRYHSTSSKIEDLPPNPVSIWVYHARNQLYFYHAVCSLIEETDHAERATALKMATLDSCLNQCGVLLNWVEQFAVDAFEHATIGEIRKQYTPVYELKLPTMYPQNDIRTHQDTMRLRCKILEERVMECIIPIVQDTTIVLDTQSIIAQIKKDVTTPNTKAVELLRIYRETVAPVSIHLTKH